MKIAVEVDVLANDAKSGVYYYIQRLLLALISQDTTNDYELIFFGDPTKGQDFHLGGSQVTLHAITWLPRKIYNGLLRTPFGLPFDLVSGVNADLYFFPRFARWPLARRKPSIVLIHDTTYLVYPETIATWYFRWYLRRSVPRALKKATQVIAISQSTKQELLRHYGADASKITVITPAVDHEVFKPQPKAEVDKVKAKYGLTGNYILTLSTQEPRKNLVRLLQAYADLDPKLQAEYSLVLAGGKGWNDDEITTLYDQLSQSLTIIRTGFVDEIDLPALYSGASLFAFVSLYEGFGMPVLEAMACGVPVVTSNNTSLPEVVGDAGIMVDAMDTTAITEALSKVLNDSALAKKMGLASSVKAKAFTWDDEAAKLKDLIERMRPQ